MKIPGLVTKKQKKEKISMVTCYDATFAKIIAATSVDAVLVGDSLGHVIMGEENTLKVTMEMMILFARAVAPFLPTKLVIVDMPFLSYQVSPQQALRNAGRLMQEGGAHGVKLEGGRAMVPQVRKIVDSGIPVMGHVGLTPQSVHQLGGYKVQGRQTAEQERLLVDALALQDAGVCALVLEMVPQELAQEITNRLTVPTIGIGAGPGCDGQVLVLHDLLGLNPHFNPRFLKKYANLAAVALESLESFHQEVRGQQFPSSEHSFA